MTKKIFKNIFLGCIAVLVSTIVIIVGVMYEFYGDELMNFGLAITPALLDFAAYMWIIEKIG